MDFVFKYLNIYFKIPRVSIAENQNNWIGECVIGISVVIINRQVYWEPLYALYSDENSSIAKCYCSGWRSFIHQTILHHDTA